MIKVINGKTYEKKVVNGEITWQDISTGLFYKDDDIFKVKQRKKVKNTLQSTFFKFLKK